MPSISHDATLTVVRYAVHTTQLRLASRVLEPFCSSHNMTERRQQHHMLLFAMKEHARNETGTKIPASHKLFFLASEMDVTQSCLFLAILHYDAYLCAYIHIHPHNILCNVLMFEIKIKKHHREGVAPFLLPWRRGTGISM